MFKKLVSLFTLVLVGALLMVGCRSTANTSGEVSEEFVIGISLLTDHPALNDAKDGFIEELENLGINADIQLQNAQGEIPNAVTIAEKFASDKVDLIFAIATPAAQSAKQVTSEIPIIFSAVTDPVQSELVESMESPGGNVTGTSDMAQMEEQLQLFKEIDPNIRKVGIVFNTSEENSRIQVESAKEIAQSLDLEIIDVGIDVISNIPQAVDSLVDRVDGIYTITDNMVASSINVVASKAIDHGLITVGAEGSHVDGGILISNGISYFDLGKQSAKMAEKILVEGKDPSDIPAEFAMETTTVVNSETLEALGLDPNLDVFK